MYSLNRIIRTISLIGAFVLAVTTARAISPSSDGGYSNETTTEANDALTTSGLSFVREQIVLWNTLGSDQEVEQSVIGPPLVPLQSLFYDDALLGRGILSTNAEPVVQIPQEVLNVEQGTVTLWVRLVDVPSSLFNGQALDFMNVATSEHSTFQLEFTANDGLGHSGWAAKLWDAQYIVYSINTFGTTSTRTLGSNGEDIFISCRWNRDGVPGHGSEKFVVARDVRKAGTNYEESDGAEWGTTFLTDATLNLHFGTEIDLIYDDLKIFNSSLTDEEVRRLYKAGRH